MNALANRLSNQTGRAVEVVAADLKDKTDLLRVEEILRHDAGLAQGEVVSIPCLHDGEQWDRYESQRKTLSGLFGNSTAAPRYR